MKTSPSELTELSQYIKKHYGTQSNMARELSVNSATVRNWLRANPRGLLKHMPEIISQKDTTCAELLSEVLYHEHLLGADKP